MLGWPRRYKLNHAFLCRYSYKRLKFAQLLGKLGVFLTLGRSSHFQAPRRYPPTLMFVLYKESLME